MKKDCKNYYLNYWQSVCTLSYTVQYVYSCVCSEHNSLTRRVSVIVTASSNSRDSKTTGGEKMKSL